MNDEEEKRLERFERLKPPSFSGDQSEDAQDFLDRCQQILRTTGAKFNDVVDNARQLEMVRIQEREEMEAKRPRGPENSSGVLSGGAVFTGSSSGYQGQQLRQRRGCFECGDVGHIKRDCPILLSGDPQHSSRPMVPAPAVPPPTQPARGGA
ncbi:uncharacterized protein [Nicotiana tomentosiformis]|uniref:uncharacterized protein n=1 Tax=Nicotiana tomentosiformis TaxID=4098 RepID=UPI00388C352F